MSRIGGSNFRFEWNGAKIADDVRAAAVIGLGQASAVLERQMKTNLSAVSPSSPGGFPGKDVGELRKSIHYNIEGTRARVGTNLDYGRYLEYGFKSTAKGKGALPVPLNREARKMLRQASAAKSPLWVMFPNLAMVKRKGKPPLLILTGGKGTRGGKQWKPMFVLKKSVTVAPRPWVLRSAAMAKTNMDKAWSNGTSRALAARISTRTGGKP